MKFKLLLAFISSHKRNTFLIIFSVLLVTIIVTPKIIQTVKASFGSWGDNSMINGCVNNRGAVTIVNPGDSCKTGETQVSWLKDIDVGAGLSIDRTSSSGAVLSLTSVNNDGWTSSSDTWTYVSANSFKISGANRTAVFTKGTRVKLTNNSSTYYGVVVSSSYSTDTTVTLASNNDYSLANSAITNPYYSYEANPQGYPTTFKYASTVSGTTGSQGTYAETEYASYFSITGNTCYVTVYKNITDSGSWSGILQVVLPVTTANFYQPLSGFISSNGASNSLNSSAYGMGQAQVSSTVMYFEKGIGSSVVGWSDVTAPFRLAINGFYQF